MRRRNVSIADIRTKPKDKIRASASVESTFTEL